MVFFAILVGLGVGLGICYLFFKGVNFIFCKYSERQFKDNGGRNQFFYTPKTTTELLLEFKKQLENGEISVSTFKRRKRKTLKRFKEGYNLNMGYNINIIVGTEDSVEHLKQLKIMQSEGLITNQEYQKLYDRFVKILNSLK